MIISIILYRARIEYCEPKLKIINANISSATNNPDTLIIDLKIQIAVNRLTEITDVENHFICSPLSLVPKSNSK